MRYPFLSERWIAALEKLRQQAPEPPPEVKGFTVNLRIVGGPDGEVGAHFRDGRLDLGLLAGAPTTVTVTYQVARSLIVDGDPNLIMMAVMAGDITVTGEQLNPAVLLAAFSRVTPEHVAFHRKVQALTS